MSQRRGFTLIELCIVIGVMAIITVPILTLGERMYAGYHKAIRLAELNSATDKVGYRIQALWRKNSSKAGVSQNRIDQDNRGLLFSDGSSLRWNNNTLILKDQGSSLVLSDQVAHFSAFQRDNTTYLTISLKDSRLKPQSRKVFLADGGDHATRI